MDRRCFGVGLHFIMFFLVHCRNILYTLMDFGHSNAGVVSVGSTIPVCWLLAPAVIDGSTQGVFEHEKRTGARQN